MNDELSGQLSSRWRIPEYAQPALWLVTENDAVQPDGDTGLFTLSVPAQELSLRFGGEEGPALAAFRWQPDTLEWDGSVTIGGLVEAITITQLAGYDVAIAVITLGGVPIQTGVQPYPTANERNKVPYSAPMYDDGLTDNVESTTSWLAPEDSALVALAENALMNNLNVWCSGHLADEESGWEQHFALPLILEGMTIFAP